MKKDKIQSMYKACSAELTSRTNEIQHLLLGEGNFDADVLVVAEVPSAKEEEYSQNLLEDSRDKLLEILDPLDLSIDDVYITHLMKYRPYRVNNKGRIVSRSPQKSELEFFIPYLEKEISLVAPKLIITLGNGPLGWLVKDTDLKVNTEEDQLLVTGVLGKSYKLYPLLHPSSRSFNKSVEKFKKEDVARLRTILYGEQVSVEEEHKNPFVDDKAIGDKIALVKKLAQEAEVKKNNGNAGTYTKKAVTSPKPSNNSNNSDNSGQNVSETLNSNKLIKDKLEEEDKLAELASEKATKKRIYNKIKLGKEKSSNSYVTIVYGGEGYVDDPVLVALERISSVLLELGMSIHRIDLHKGSIPMEKAFEYINESKGVILAVNVEWFGIGYQMQKFLDDCFFRGDESYFRNKALMGVCFTRSAFEQEAYNHLLRSWEILGGLAATALMGVIKSAAELETNFDWLYGIDKKTESYFRCLKQDKGILPRSNKVAKISIEMPVSEEDISILSSIKSKEKESVKEVKSNGLIEDYDAFVEKQQKDILEISSIFKKKLSTKVTNKDQSLPRLLKDAYKFKGDIQTNIQFVIDDQLKENTVIELNNQYIRSYFGQLSDVDVVVSGSKDIFTRILTGKVTMQRAFMTGEVKAKGDFTILYKFEEYFNFKES